MKVLKRSKEAITNFKLVAGNDLWKYKIVQIVFPQIYENKHGYAVFLCEIEKESEEMTDGN